MNWGSQPLAPDQSASDKGLYHLQNAFRKILFSTDEYSPVAATALPPVGRKFVIVAA